MSKKRTGFYSNLYLQRRILKLKIDIIQTIAQGIEQKLSKRQILAQVKQQVQILSRALDLAYDEVNQLWTDAVREYDTISRRSYAKVRRLRKKELDSPENVNGAIYASIRARIMHNDLIKETNSVVYRYEFRHKHDYVYGQDGLLADAKESRSPFFLCSSHPKPAKDHRDWEGKMYYDEDWEEYVPDEAGLHTAIRAYIQNRQLRSVQWVTGAPVFLVTRRNCKHYLKNIPLDEVLHSSPRSLLAKHGLWMEDERSVPEEVLVYREYYNRMKIQEALYKVIPSNGLKEDIKKLKKTLLKWKNSL